MIRNVTSRLDAVVISCYNYCSRLLRAEQVSYCFHWKKHPCAGRQLYKRVFPVEFAGLLIDRVCVRATLSCFPGAGGFNIVLIKIFLSSTD